MEGGCGMIERLCRLTRHWFGTGWVASWMNYQAGPHVKRVYFRRCRWCGDESG